MPPHSAPARKRVLVCDDIPELREHMATTLARRLPSLEVVSVASGRDALDAHASCPFDAAVVDAHMPGVHGIEVCMRLRKASPAMGIALVSAFQVLPLSSSGFGAIGVDVVALKPFGPTRFAQTVRHLVYTPSDVRARLRAASALHIESEMGAADGLLAERSDYRWCERSHPNPRGARFCNQCGDRLGALDDVAVYTPEFGDLSLARRFAATIEDDELRAVFLLGLERMREARERHGFGASRTGSAAPSA